MRTKVIPLYNRPASEIQPLISPMLKSTDRVIADGANMIKPKKREKAVIVAHSAVERTYGLLIGIKPFVAPLGERYLAVVDDGLMAINQQRCNG